MKLSEVIEQLEEIRESFGGVDPEVQVQSQPSYPILISFSGVWDPHHPETVMLASFTCSKCETEHDGELVTVHWDDDVDEFTICTKCKAEDNEIHTTEDDSTPVVYVVTGSSPWNARNPYGHRAAWAD